LQCVAVCCSVLQCVAVQWMPMSTRFMCMCVCALGVSACAQSVALCCSMLQSVAVCCSLLQSVAVCCSVL